MAPRVEFAGTMIRVVLDGKTYIESKDSDDFKYGK